MKAPKENQVSRSSRATKLGGIAIAVVACALLLSASGKAAAAQPQSVTATGTYLFVDYGQAAVTPSGRAHTIGMQAIVSVDSPNPLFRGRLTWWGEANTDTGFVGVCHGFGIIELGTWDFTQPDPENPLLPLFIPSGGHWDTKFEVAGNFLSGPYEGIVNSHGVDGPIDGMNAVLPFTGGWGLDNYSGQYVVPGK